MVNYECKLCNFNSKIKSHYERHKNTNKHKINEIECGKIEAKKSEKKRKKAKKSEKKRKDATGEKKEQSGYKKIKCEYCLKCMTKKHLIKHHRTTCVKIPSTIKDKYLEKYNNDKRVINNKIVLFDKKFINDNQYKNENYNENSNKNGNGNNIIYKGEINNNNNTINNSNNFNNIQNNISNNINININPFGKENIKNIDEKNILKILNNAYCGFPHLLKELHFSVEENRNIYQPNLNKPFIKYYNGNRWLSDKFDSIKNKIFNKVSRVLEDWFEEYQTKLNNKKLKTINNLIDDCNDGKINEAFTNELKMFFIDYSNEIKEHISKELNNSNLLEDE